MLGLGSFGAFLLLFVFILVPILEAIEPVAI